MIEYELYPVSIVLPEDTNILDKTECMFLIIFQPLAIRSSSDKFESKGKPRPAIGIVQDMFDR
jgi:hypothetical protein